MVGLATRYSTELRTNYGDVLQQLEDLRLAEWSDHAPPPPLAPSTSIMTSTASNNEAAVGPSRGLHLHQPQSYVNYPSSSGHHDNEPTYVPGSFSVRNKSLDLNF